MQSLETRGKRLQNLPATSLHRLAGHTCTHCQKIIIDPTSSYWIHTLPYTIDECLQAAFDGCIWYSLLLDYVKRSQKPAKELDKDRFFFDINIKYRDFTVDGSVTRDILSLTVKTGTINYSWPCLKFDVFAESGEVLVDTGMTRDFCLMRLQVTRRHLM